MKVKTICAFIGHRKIEKTERLRQRINEVITALIEEEGADTFLFGSKSEFDDICLEVVTNLKVTYPHIRRIYVRSAFEYIDEQYIRYLLSSYDDTFFPDKVSGAGYRSYIKRNQEMIDGCDILITYFDKNYKPSAGRSGTKTAVEYAIKKNKRIINLFE